MTLNKLLVDEATRLGTGCGRTPGRWGLRRLLLLLILPIGCADRPLSGLKAEIPEPRLQFDLVPVRTFGEPGLDSASDAALGRIASIVAADDSTLYVLDSDFQRITVFSPSGEFLRHIYGGFGEGPGEFRLPIFMDVAEDVFVYDYRQSRVSRFSRRGEFLASFQLDHLTKQFAVVGDELWFTLLPARDTLVVRTTIEGEFRGTLLNASQDDIAFSPSGLAPTIATSLDGSTAYVGVTRPGVWHRIRIPSLEHARVGRPFYPEYESAGSAVPGQVLGMTALASIVLASYAVSSRRTHRRPPRSERPPWTYSTMMAPISGLCSWRLPGSSTWPRHRTVRRSISAWANRIPTSSCTTWSWRVSAAMRVRKEAAPAGDCAFLSFQILGKGASIG